MSSLPGAPTSESLLAPEAPYRGLTPYSVRDAPLFFGREDECDIVIANMMASRLTLLYGASGVGKSSLLRAGVTHELLGSSRRNLAAYGSPEFIVAYFNRWSDNDPLGALRRCVDESVETVMGTPPDVPAAAPTDLAGGLSGLTGTLESDLLIILDQFEEYFLYHPGDGGDGSFAVEFPRAVNRADLRVSFLVTIREDALARLDRFKGPLPNLFENYLRARHLDLAAARAAIERPLEAYNRLAAPEQPFTIEPELTTAILDEIQTGKVALGATGRGVIERGDAQDAAARRIETPYLQLVLTRLWREEVAAGSSTLRAETLRRLGGAEQIVRTHLDQALRALPDRQQDVAAGIFHHLVTPSGTKIAHTAPDLADYADLPQGEVTSVLEKLSRGDARILRPVPPPFGQPDETPAYEIFHDVLAPAVLDWWTRHTEARAAEKRLGRRLERSAQETRAAEARAHHYRQLLRRVSVIAMALLLVLVSAVAVLAVRGQREAVRSERSSRSRELAAQAITKLAVDPASSVRLTLDALAADSTSEAQSALRRALSEPASRVVARHGDWLMSASPSPDGRTVLTASLDNTVAIWSLATGARLASLSTGKPAYHLAGRPQLSADGRQVLVTNRAGEVKVWRWDGGGRPVVVSKGQDAYRAAFAPDGVHVATGHIDGSTRVWDLRTRRSAAVLPPSGDGEITAMAFSPDGELLATGAGDGTVRLWRWGEHGGPLLLKGHQDWVNVVAFSRDGARLLSASDDGTARLSAVPDGRPLGVLDGGGNPVNDAAFSPDGRLVATAGLDKTARLFAVPDGRQVRVLRSQADELADVAFSPDGELLATASADGTAALWSVRAGGTPVVLRGHAGQLFTVAFTPNGRSLVSASADGTARLWEVPARQVFTGNGGPLNMAGFGPGDRRIVTAGEDGTVREYDTATGRQVAMLKTDDQAVTSATFRRDGRRVVTAGLAADDGGIARLWNPSAPGPGRVVARDDDEFNSAELSPDGRLLLTATELKAVVREARTGRPRVTITLPEAETRSNPFAKILAARFSPDASQVLTTHYNKTALLWDARTGKLMKSLEGHDGIVYGAEFSRDGRRVVTAGGDSTARIWDPADGRRLRTLTSPAGSLQCVAFSPDGRWVAAGAVTGDVSVWEVATGQLVAELHPHAELVTSLAFSEDSRWILAASDDRTATMVPCESCRPLEELLAVARQRERSARGGP